MGDAFEDDDGSASLDTDGVNQVLAMVRDTDLACLFIFLRTLFAGSQMRGGECNIHTTRDWQTIIGSVIESDKGYFKHELLCCLSSPMGSLFAKHEVEVGNRRK